MFVPAVSPAAWLNGFAPLTALFLRQDTHIALSMQLRYTLMVVPGIFYGTILWWAQRPPKLSQRTRRIWTACLCLSLLFTFTLNPSRTWSFLLPDSFDPWVHLSLTKQWNHANEVRSLIAQIPTDASLAATDNLLPHVSNRRAVLRFPRREFQNDDGEAVFCRLHPPGPLAIATVPSCFFRLPRSLSRMGVLCSVATKRNSLRIGGSCSRCVLAAAECTLKAECDRCVSAFQAEGVGK